MIPPSNQPGKTGKPQNQKVLTETKKNRGVAEPRFSTLFGVPPAPPLVG